MICQDESEYSDILKEFPFDDTEVSKVLEEMLVQVYNRQNKQTQCSVK